MRARACALESNDCFRRFWPLVPQLLKISIRAGMEASAAGLSKPEIAAAIVRAQARWHATQAPPQTTSPAPQSVEAAVAPPRRVAASARSGPRIRML